MKLENLFDEHVITIDQYLLTHLVPEDASYIYAIYNDPRSTQYQALKRMVDPSEGLHYIENAKLHIEHRYFMKWAIRDALTYELVGLFSVHHMDLLNHNCQFGYVLNPSHWHKGIMKKVLTHMSNSLLNQSAFHRIELNIHPENSASIHVAKQCGYVNEGLKKQCAYNITTHSYEDRYMFSKLIEY